METQFIKLNMTPTGINPCFHVSQYDIGRSLGFMIYNGSEVVDLDSYTCTIEATRSDGVAITASVTTDDNVGTFETTATMTNKADKYKAQFVIVDENSKRIASLPFDMEVTKAAMDENAEAIEEDASLYQQYAEAVQGAIAEVNADIQAEETARIAAVAAEATARANADTTLQNNIDAEATARQTADNTLQGNISSEAATRASADSNLQSQINQIIAPSGEAPSAAEVQNARIGADGITYDTLGNAIRGQVGDLKSALNDADIFKQINISDADAGWISWDGQVITGQSDWYHKTFNVKKGDIVKVYSSGYATNVSMIGVYSNGTYTNKVRSVDATVQWYEYTFTEDCTAYVTIHNLSTSKVEVVTPCASDADFTDAKNELSNELSLTNILINKIGYKKIDLSDAVAGWIQATDGSVIQSGAWMHKDVELKCGDILHVYARGYSTNVGMISPKTNSGYGSYYVRSEGYVFKDYTYEATADMTVGITIDSITNSFVYIDSKKTNLIQLFHKIGIIGDSLSSGVVYDANGANPINNYDYSWLSCIGRKNGIDVYHYATGGMFCKRWMGWSRGARAFGGDQQVQAEICPMYIIALGTNDANTETSGYDIGTISDAAGTDSFVGYYKQIINTVHTYQPNAVILCVSLYNRSDTAITYSEMIENIAELYSYCYYVPLIDYLPQRLTSNFGDSSIWIKTNHYSGLGYVVVAEIMEKLINNIIWDNISDFKQLAYTNHGTDQPS